MTLFAFNNFSIDFVIFSKYSFFSANFWTNSVGLVGEISFTIQSATLTVPGGIASSHLPPDSACPLAFFATL
jgi:hypothetical protein